MQTRISTRQISKAFATAALYVVNACVLAALFNAVLVLGYLIWQQANFKSDLMLEIPLGVVGVGLSCLGAVSGLTWLYDRDPTLTELKGNKDKLPKAKVRKES